MIRTDHPRLSNQRSSPPEAIKSRLTPASRGGTPGDGITGPVTGSLCIPKTSTKTVGVGAAGMGVGVGGTGVGVTGTGVGVGGIGVGVGGTSVGIGVLVGVLVAVGVAVGVLVGIWVGVLVGL